MELSKIPEHSENSEYSKHSNQVECFTQSIHQKAFSSLLNGGTFWLFSILLTVLLMLYVRFFISKPNNILSRQEPIRIAGITFSLNYIVLAGLLWVSYLLITLFN